MLVQLLCRESDAAPTWFGKYAVEAAARDADQRVRVSAAAARALGRLQRMTKIGGDALIGCCHSLD